MQEVKPPKLPDYLFKYRSLGNSTEELDYIREMIVDGEVYWPSPVQFNDPFDCFPAFRFPTGRKMHALSNKLHKKHNPNAPRHERRHFRRLVTNRNNTDFENMFIGQIEQLMEESSVYSLATAPDNILMWSHYANSHKGVCLRLDATKLAFEHMLVAPVSYSETRPEVIIGDEEAQHLLEKMLLTKSKLWEYEKEWRILGYKQPRGKRTLPTGCLNGIVLGWRISTDDRKTILEMTEELEQPIAIYEAVRDSRLFALNLIPLNPVAEKELNATTAHT